MTDWNFDMSTAPRDGTWIMALCQESNQDPDLPKPCVATVRWEESCIEHWESTSPTTKQLVREDNSHWYAWEEPIAWAPMPDLASLLDRRPRAAAEAAA